MCTLALRFTGLGSECHGLEGRFHLSSRSLGKDNHFCAVLGITQKALAFEYLKFIWHPYLEIPI